MPRQPFLPTYKGSTVAIGASVIERLPKVAELVGRIAINWSGVDLQLSLALGSMLGVENPAAVAVFLSLRNHRAQRDALRAAADKALSGESRQIFEAILDIHEELDGQRNDAVHCVWGVCDATPDGVVWSSLQDHGNMLITDYHQEKAGTLTNDSRVYNMTKDLFVVRLRDLEELNRSITALDRAIGNFHAYLRYDGQSAGAHAYRELKTNAAIAKRLSSDS